MCIQSIKILYYRTFTNCILKVENSNPVIWKEQVVLVVGAAFSRDHLISRLEAAPTEGFYGNLGFSDMR